MFSFKDDVFSGLTKVSINDISNITTGIQGNNVFIKFVLNIFLTYNVSAPTKQQNQTTIIEQAQKTLLTQCDISSFVNVTSVSASLIVTSSVRLNTASRKKRLIDSTSICNDEKQSFSMACPNSNQLKQCDPVRLNAFLNSYISQTVIYKVY